MSKFQTQSVSGRVCDVFEEGCMYCANRPPTVFNPESYPQKMHVAEMTYCSPQGTLYVRETTAEVEKAPGDDYIAPPEKKVPEPAIIDPFEEISPGYFKGLKQSCSGITFVEEKEERARDAIYKATLKVKLEQRALWRAFLKHIHNYKKMRQMKGVGPNWFQELSTAQITLLDTLHSVLKADTDEKSVTYTKRFLSEMGITTLDSRHIEKAIVDCELDPLFFLARIQKEVNILESKKAGPVSDLANFKKKKRPYTVSERILLSSIVHLHLPILLFKLHLILPGPDQIKSGKKLKNVLAPLPESSKLPDPKKEWYRPDMSTQDFDFMLSELETAPINDSKATINKQIEDSPSIWTMVSIAPIRERKSQYFQVDGKTKEGQSPPVQVVDIKEAKKLERRSEDGFEGGPNDFPSFQSFYQGMEPCTSAYFLMDSFTQTNVSFHENQPFVRHGKVLKECDSLTEKVEEEIIDLIQQPGSHKAEKFEKVIITTNQLTQTDAHWLPADTSPEVIQLFGSEYTDVVLQKTLTEEKIHTELVKEEHKKEEPELEDVIADIIATIFRKPTENEMIRKEKLAKCLEHYDIDGLYEIFGLEKQKQELRTSASNSSRLVKRKQKLPGEKSKRKSVTSVSSATSSVRSAGEDELETLILKIKDEVKKQPFSNQLQVALKILAVSGDPVADFPDLHKHPVIRRWYEIRRGIKRKLSDKEKASLLDKSRKAWMSIISIAAEVKTPAISSATPEELAKFTWDKRQWVKKQAHMIQDGFNHELRQALVDDARILYPTMRSTYYDSKLNQNFRKVFFTYLPAKENDYYTYKLWRPEDVKNKKELK